MKKISILMLITIFLSLVSCSNSKSPLQEATNATNKESKFIEKILMEELSITCKSVESTDADDYIVLEGMADFLEAYEITSEDNETYILIINSKNKDIFGVLDEESNLAFGLIDNGGLPKYFEQKETRGSSSL